MIGLEENKVTNLSTKNIDIFTEEGLSKLKDKAKFYGYYAQNLKVLELIEEIESLRANTPENIEKIFLEKAKGLGW